MPFSLGQRWLSDAEPDLALGIVVAADQRSVSLLFPATGEQRTYSRNNAPVTRIEFEAGDQLTAAEGWQLTVTDVEEQNGCLYYLGIRTDTQAETVLPESQLDHKLKLNRPEARLLAGQVERLDRFALRYQAWQQLANWQTSPLRGLGGARIALVPHQLHIGYLAGQRYQPRLLLADEVGLGKTIEAGLIIHQQLLTGAAERVLILVPEPLLHQWLVEMLRRFNLSFALFNEERIAGEAEEQANPFEQQQLILCARHLMEDTALREQALAAGFDLMVVDEAHHLEWHPQQPSPAYQAVESLAAAIGSVLLLTATPDQLGHESHFARLRLLDPDRFYDYQAFLGEEQQYRQVAQAAEALLDEKPLDNTQIGELTELLSERDIEPQLRCINSADEHAASARQELLFALLDRHGTSRVMFRNSRAAISGFPGRCLHQYPLKNPRRYHELALFEDQLYPDRAFSDLEQLWWEFDPRVEWLIELLGQLKQEKVLLICAHADTALELAEALKTREGIVAACFHEQMSIIERDRAAAHFAEEEGARLLICSEIGSEGRNFQFAHHLVLFDLPANPDLLEQRIGRLDRIGQQAQVEIHLPYLLDTAQQYLAHWYHHGLGAFEQITPCGGALFAQFGQRLQTIEAEALEALCSETKAAHQQMRKQLEQGRDKLLEIHSSGAGRAAQLTDQLAVQDQSIVLPQYMFSMFDAFGLDQEDKDDNLLILRPSEQMLISHFPGLNNEEGTLITFDRSTALAREEAQFISWDHPMVRQSTELLLGSEMGNNAVALLPTTSMPAGTYFVELIFVVQAQAPAVMKMERYLPATPCRLLLDANGKNLADAVAAESLERQLSPVKKMVANQLVTALKTPISALVAKGETLAEQLRQQVTEGAAQRIRQELDSELERLESLRAVNPSIRDEELAYIKHRQQSLLEQLGSSSIVLDAVRLIVVSHES